MTQIDLNKYKEFVDAVTSDHSKDNDAFVNNWNILNMEDVNMPRLLTASCGLGARDSMRAIARPPRWPRKKVGHLRHRNDEGRVRSKT